MENTLQNIEPHTVNLPRFLFISLSIEIGSCFLDTGYVYNTEAHPIDIGALDCCSSAALVNEKSSKKVEKHLLVTTNRISLIESLFFSPFRQKNR